MRSLSAVRGGTRLVLFSKNKSVEIWLVYMSNAHSGLFLHVLYSIHEIFMKKKENDKKAQKTSSFEL